MSNPNTPIVLTGSSALAVEISELKRRIGHLEEALQRQDNTIIELKALLTHAADALTLEMVARHSQAEIRDYSELIAQLRKAAG